MQNISNNELFKNPIEIETQYCEYGRKYYYNPRMPNWLNPEFSLAELLCSYFEQSILINYQYYLLYQQEINFLYYDKLEDLFDNFCKLLDFIGSQNGEKRIAIIQSVKNDEIKKIIYENYNIRKIILDKREKDEKILNYFGKFLEHKNHTIKDKVNSMMIALENSFIKGDLNFMKDITFIRNNNLFQEEDFIIKIVFDKINNYWKNKTAEDFLQELSTNYEKKNINKKKNKKKKKKINNNNKNEEKENKDNIKIHNNLEKNNENINKKNNLIEINEKSISNESEKTEKTDNKIEIKNNNLNEDVVINNNMENINDNNNKEEIKKENIEEEKNNKKKKEKNFFLYPVVKSKNKKNKNKKNKKINNNEITNKKESEENNENKNKEKENDSKNDLNKKIEKNENQNQNDEKNKKKNEKLEKIKNIKNDFDYSSKHKNKFNIGIKYRNINKDNSINFINNENNINYFKNNNYKQNFVQSQEQQISELNENKNNGNNGYFNQNKKESNISRSKEDDKYLLAGSNFPSFTSFNFKSNKKGRNTRNKKNKDMCPYSFLSNNISELSKEIIENTRKVNKNKEILQKIREKYIKNIYEIINIILKDENLDFLCSFYGSSISGLSIENSDIDIMVKLKQNKTEYNYISRVMQNVFNNLKKNNINYLTNIIPIYTASVPVIKLECDLSNDEHFSHEINNIINNCDLSYNDITKLYFDITFFEVENENNKIPSELMIDYIKESIIIYPQLIDIIYIMKRFLFNKKLNKSYKGGISSYSLFLLTLAFIKNFKDYYNIPIGSFLIEYLYYYSNFDFYNYIIQPENNNENEKEIYSKTEQNSIYKYNLNIVDPITGINVAKSTFKMDEIKNAFKEGLNIIIGNLYKVNRIDDFYSTCKNDKKILDIFLTK